MDILQKSLLACCLAAAYVPVAPAADAITSFEVSAKFAGVCGVSATPLDFGQAINIAIPAAGVAGQNTITVTCATGTGYTVKLGSGLGGASCATRKMTAGTSTLNYSLYKEIGHSTVWGDGGGGAGCSETVTGTGSGAAQPLTVYGLIAGIQTAATDAFYMDTISVTLSF